LPGLVDVFQMSFSRGGGQAVLAAVGAPKLAVSRQRLEVAKLLQRRIGHKRFLLQPSKNST
jgi:hypothetical protein